MVKLRNSQQKVPVYLGCDPLNVFRKFLHCMFKMQKVNFATLIVVYGKLYFWLQLMFSHFEVSAVWQMAVNPRYLVTSTEDVPKLISLVRV